MSELSESDQRLVDEAMENWMAYIRAKDAGDSNCIKMAEAFGDRVREQADDLMAVMVAIYALKTEAVNRRALERIAEGFEPSDD